MKPRYRVTFEHDNDPDYSWLAQECFDQVDPQNALENHVSICMLVEKLGPKDDDWQPVDSLCGIDFLADSDDWTVGTFYSLKALKPRSYLRQLAREAGMR